MEKSEIVIIYQEPGKNAILEKIKNDIEIFSKLIGRSN